MQLVLAAVGLMALLWGTQLLVRRQLESQQTDDDA